jgi:hypothetical protein
VEYRDVRAAHQAKSSKFHFELGALNFTSIENSRGQAEQQRRELVMFADIKNNLKERGDTDSGILEFNPGTVQADIQAAQLRLTLLQSAVASQKEILRKLRQGGSGGPTRGVPHRKVSIVSVPDPVSPPKDAIRKCFYAATEG